MAVVELLSRQLTMIRILTSLMGFLVSYLSLMIPTYLLPYAGSNSSIINGMGALLGRGPTPQWWMHFWCLFMLILLGHIRGRLVGKPYLLVFPVLALVFDLTPVLSSIPLVPTVMHLLCLVLGVWGHELQAALPAPTPSAEEQGYLSPTLRGTTLVAVGVSALALLGSLYFVTVAPAVAAAERARQAAAFQAELKAQSAAAEARIRQSWEEHRKQSAAPIAPQAATVVLAPPAQGMPTPAKAPEASPAAPKPAATTSQRPANTPHKPAAPPPSAHAPKADKPTVRMININEP